MNADVQERIRKIKIILTDVDGVLTDGTIYKGNDGVELKRFSVLDGAGIALLKVSGLRMAIISGRHSPATDARIKELGLEEDCYQRGLDKMSVYEELKNKYAFEDDEAVFVGDDIIDLPVMRTVGFPIAVANAHSLVKKAARITTEARGGEGALREVVELVLKAQGIYDTTLERLNQKMSKRG